MSPVPSSNGRTSFQRAPLKTFARAVSALALAGCGRASARVVAVVDTLPSGAVRVTSDRPTGWSDPAGGWVVTEARRYGTGGGAGELIEPGSIAVDGGGRVYVVDRKPTVIKVYDSSGTFLHTVGREGSGPGEFKVAFMAVRGDRVLVHDPMQGRTSVFDTSGAFLKSWVSSCCYWDEVMIDASGRAYVPTMVQANKDGTSRGRAYSRYRLTGELVDTLFVPDETDRVKTWMFARKSKDGKQRSMMSTSVPYSPVPVVAYHPNGGFVRGWSGEYRLIRTLRGPDTAAVVARRWVPDPIPEPLRAARVAEVVKNAKDMVGEDEARAVARLDEVPKTAPAFTGLRVDDEGFLWVRRFSGGDSTRTTFDVFDPAGPWLGPVSLPVAVPEYGGHLVAAGSFYTTAEGDDGRPAVIRYRIGRRGH